MKKKATFAAAILLSALAAAFAANRENGRGPLTAAALMEHVTYLASPELQGRGSGTPGCEKAAAYIAEQFRKAGLKPMGDNGDFFQWFEVTTGAKVGEKNSLQFDPAFPGLGNLELRRDFLPVTMSGPGAVNGSVVFAGYGIEASDPKYNDYAGVEVKDKIVLLMRHSPDGAGPHNQFVRYSSLRYKVMSARGRGAKAILLCVGPSSPKEIEELGPWNIEQGVADSGISALFLKREVAEALLRAAGKDLKQVQQEINEKKQPQSFEIPGVTVRLSAEVIKERSKTANVIGYLPGNGAASQSETIVIGAHYDHLGLGEQAGSREPSAKGKIHHGADDNASGTAGVIELARYFAAKRGALRRGMLFMAFSGEEMGLLGSRHFVENPTLPLNRVIGMLNLDMIGRMKNGRVEVLCAGTSPFWKEAIKTVNGGIAGLKPEVSGAGTDFGGSDHQSFYMKNIPVLHFFTGVHEDYHRPSDISERINAEGTAQISRLVAHVAEQLQAVDKPISFVKLEEPRRSAGGGGFRVYLGTIPDYAAEVQGVRLEGVRENGPAAKAGLKAGDIIVSIAGKSIKNVQEYSQMLSELSAGKAVEVIAIRNGQKLTLTLTPESR